MRAFIQRLQAAVNELRETRRKDSLRIAADATALTKIRVQSTGSDYQGNPFTPYTTPYTKQKAADGFQVANPDFTATGEAFNNIEQVVIEDTDTRITVEVRGKSDLTRNKMRGWAKKRPPVLRPSKSEIAFVVDSHIKRLKKVLEQ